MPLSRNSIAEIYCPVNGSVGSGYFCTSRLILTAKHVVSGAILSASAQEIRPSAQGDEFIGTLAKTTALCRVRPLGANPSRPFWDAVPVWWSIDKDVALLALVDRQAAPIDVPPLTWSELPESESINVTAVGFPEADASEGVRESRQISGHLNPLSGVKSGRFVIHVDGSIGRVPTGAASSWAGMSGSALFAGESFIGLIVVDADPADPDRLELFALPARTFAADPVFISWMTWDGGEKCWNHSTEPAADKITLILTDVKNRSLESSLREYLRALDQYSDSAYRILASRFPEELTLEDVYVPLSVKAAGKTMSVAEAVKVDNQLLIEGPPGSGKSTLLRQIARHAWRNPASVGLDKPYIALPIRLRSLAQSDGASREERVRRAIDKAHDLEIAGPRLPDGFMEAWPRSTEAPWLFLLDGFDEVPEEKREEVIIWMRRIIDNHAVVITSRPTSALPDAIRTRLREFTVEPFTAKQQKLLAAKWLGSGAESFIRNFEHFAGGELGGTPLLLTIAAIVYHNSGSLPSRRSELYRIFVNDTWQESIKKGAEEELGADLLEIAPKLVPDCLGHIALLMTGTEDQGASLDFGMDLGKLTANIEEVLASQFDWSKPVTEVRAERLTKFLGERSGVLQATPDHCEWLHPTFREFFAAQAVVKKGKSTLESTIGKFTEQSWRQVVLFLIGILSEQGSVNPYISQILSSDPRWGAIFAGVAIAEGADVDNSLKQRVVVGLCEDIRENGEGWICNRLLAKLGKGDGRESRSALLPFLNNADLQPTINKLKSDLASFAIKFGKLGSCAIDDLRELRAEDTLSDLASDLNVPLLVRADAAMELYALGRAKIGRENLLNILSADITSLPFEEFTKVVVRVLDSELISELSVRNVITDERWKLLLDGFLSNNSVDIVQTLASDNRIPLARRTIASIYLQSDGEGLIRLLPSLSEQGEALNLCFDLLVKRRDHEALLRLAKHGFTSRIQLLALRALKSAAATDQLKRLMDYKEGSYSLRRRASEILYSGSSLDEPLAALLLDFFLPLGTRAKRPSLFLSRTAFLQYFLDRSESALVTLELLAGHRNLTAWELSLRGHCLERLDRNDQAIVSYDAAIELDPGSNFPRCHRAHMRWERNEYSAALPDVEELEIYETPEWFRKYAGDILRECGKRKEAQSWLDSAVESETESAMARAFRGVLSFEQGRFGAATDDLRKAFELSPGYLWGTKRFARVLRVSGQFAQALEIYTKLLEDHVDDTSLLSARVEILLRVGQFKEAGRDIATLRARRPAERWYVYLEGLLARLQGDQGSFAEAIANALNGLATQEQLSALALSNQALFSVAQGKSEQAQKIYNRLLADGELNHLRYFSLPELSDLASAIPECNEIPKLRNYLMSALWPEGCGFEPRVDKQIEALKAIKRTPYPFPMYCQLSGIHGLDGDRRLASDLLTKNPSPERTIILWTLGQPDRLYGHCNFKKDEDSRFDLKFCDSTALILGTNLRIFVKQFGVRRLLFLEPTLLQTFQDGSKLQGLLVTCVLVAPPTYSPLDRYLEDMG